MVSSDFGRFTMRAVAASTSSLSQLTSGNSFAICAAISSHITIAWRCALLLVTTVRSLRGRDCASPKAKRMIRSTPARVMIETSVAASIGWPWWTRPPTPAYSPSEFSRTITQSRSLGAAALQRRVDAGQDPRRPHVRVLVEALADLQAQAPERDVIRDVRIAGRAEQDRVLAAQRIEAVVRHHDAVRAEVVAAPVEGLELEAKGIARCSERFEQPLAGGNDFLADAVARDAGDPIGLHVSSPTVVSGRACASPLLVCAA